MLGISTKMAHLEFNNYMALRKRDEPDFKELSFEEYKSKLPENDRFQFGYEQPLHWAYDICDVKEMQKLDKLYCYTCHSLDEIFFAVLHYHAVNGFKFSVCQHCGRLFSTQTFKVKYCNRKSTLRNYQTYECAIAVKRIIKKLQDRKKSIYNNWQVNAGSDSDKIYRLINQCGKYMDAIKECASIENLKAYEDYLKSDEFPKRIKKRANNSKDN